VSTVVVVLAVALAASGCQFLRRPIPGTSGFATVGVSPPGAAGARTVSVSVDGLASGTKGTVTVRVDAVDGKPAAVAKSVPAQLVVPGSSIGPGDHTLFVKVKVDKRFAVGVAKVSGSLRINQLQVVGSHNSYHVQPPPPAGNIPQWQYTHSPLGVQFESEGVRQIELDLYVDPNGHKVVHIVDLDTVSTCPTFVACLTAVKEWSDANPSHLPLAILTELKDDSLGTPTPILPWDVAAMDQLDAEIDSVFPSSQVLTPDEVRGSFPTLDAAVRTKGWPAIDSVRGQVMFLMDNGGSYRTRYLQGHPSLAGRILFTNSTPGAADGGFVKRNDALDANVAEIQSLVAAGYLVRTRADGDTFEARTNDTTRRDAALLSAAQWVSTDYPVPGRAFGTPYFVSMPGGTPARCNPVNAPPWCTSTQIENLPG
jgi:hypothetical protein